MSKLMILNHTDNPTPLYVGGIGTSNAIDLYTAEEVTIHAGEFKLVDTGVSIRVPEGYKADLKPRSSTFKNFGIIQTNSVGLIDYTFSGKNDRIMMPVFMPITSDDINKAFGNFIHNVFSQDSANTSGKTEKEIIADLSNVITRSITIPKGTRLCQLEILKASDIDELISIPESEWNFDDRGGFGSTGTK